MGHNDIILVEAQPGYRRKMAKHRPEEYYGRDEVTPIPLYSIVKTEFDDWMLRLHSFARLHRNIKDDGTLEVWRTDKYVTLSDPYLIKVCDTKKEAMEVIDADTARKVEPGHYRVYPEDNEDLRGVGDPFKERRMSFVNQTHANDELLKL